MDFPAPCLPTKPNLGLIDVVLEDEDGILCASRLKSLSPFIRMVMISAYPDREFRRRALSAGAIAFLDKKIWIRPLCDK